MLSIKNLQAEIDGKRFLKGLILRYKQERFMLLWVQMDQEKAPWHSVLQEERF